MFYADYSYRGDCRTNVKFPTLDKAVLVLTSTAERGGAISGIRNAAGETIVPDSELFTPAPLIDGLDADLAADPADVAGFALVT
ncbi:hypothetical protein [Actinomadura sp. 3N407]|uniref:hypothetical protein n=1 Tax=Actinomadura sp. 3N407 TaxID=3457423 RepID=UPI003FCCD660